MGQLLCQLKYHPVRGKKKPACKTRQLLFGLILEHTKPKADQSKKQPYESSDAERNFHACPWHTLKCKRDV